MEQAYKKGLAAKHKLGFITSSIKQTEDEDSVKEEKWITWDFMVSFWIINSVKLDFIEPLCTLPLQHACGKHLVKVMVKAVVQ